MVQPVLTGSGTTHASPDDPCFFAGRVEGIYVCFSNSLMTILPFFHNAHASQAQQGVDDCPISPPEYRSTRLCLPMDCTRDLYRELSKPPSVRCAGSDWIVDFGSAR